VVGGGKKTVDSRKQPATNYYRSLFTYHRPPTTGNFGFRPVKDFRRAHPAKRQRPPVNSRPVKIYQKTAILPRIA
jgi:hypothetical protein